MSATKIIIEGLADNWTATVEVGGRVSSVAETNAQAVTMLALAAYVEMSAPPPEDKPAPVVEPEEPEVLMVDSGASTRVYRLQDPAALACKPFSDAVDTSLDPGAVGGIIIEPETPSVEAAPQEVETTPAPEPAPAVVITAEPDGGGTVATAAPVVEAEVSSTAPAPSLADRALLRSRLSQDEWDGMPLDDRAALIASQNAFERAGPQPDADA